MLIQIQEVILSVLESAPYLLYQPYLLYWNAIGTPILAPSCTSTTRWTGTDRRRFLESHEWHQAHRLHYISSWPCRRENRLTSAAWQVTGDKYTTTTKILLWQTVGTEQIQNPHGALTSLWLMFLFFLPPLLISLMISFIPKCISIRLFFGILS